VTPDTPLTEVARHLPREAATQLSDYEPDVQMAVLTQIRAMVVYWEKQHVFDPIAYEGLLNGLVPVLTLLYAELGRLRSENARLSALLAGADYLIKDMGETIAQMAAEPSADEERT